MRQDKIKHGVKNMNDKKVIRKIKEYLELDSESNSNENCKLYAEQLLEWINKWQEKEDNNE
tara:strand:- start:1053 stop:1235 length:183 start_codon:yes stop_codon:yes gene_type:complete